MKPVRIGVIGVGNMGSSHARDCAASEYVELFGVCDTDPGRLDGYRGDIPTFDDARQLLDSEGLEAVIIATPHYDHTPISIAAFDRGIHVLCEKPVGSQVRDVGRMIDAYERARASNSNLQFGAMFQQRTNDHWRKVHEIVTSGRLGTLVRATWIITDWFRPQCYYDMGAWRATWAGEGGGVLLNQCIHNLDLYQWFFGLPSAILAQVALGKYHRIEVEDEITALFRHENGMIGQFVSSTAESPGTNRLEIVGEYGKLVFEDGRLMHDRNSQSMLEAIRTETRPFMHVEHETEEINLSGTGGSHRETIERFAQAVRDGSPLVADGREGIGSITLANGILMSHFLGRSVDVPLDAAAYATLLDDLAGGHAPNSVDQS